MERAQVISEVRKFFDIDELVCDHVYSKYGQSSWQFLDTMYLWCLLVIRRDIIKRPMYCNGSQKHQRGLRCNLCDLVKTKKVPYLSAHVMGKAGDFTITGMTAEEARKKIIAYQSLLPCPIRMENAVSWLHFDVRFDWNQTTKVKLFNA